MATKKKNTRKKSVKKAPTKTIKPAKPKKAEKRESIKHKEESVFDMKKIATVLAGSTVRQRLIELGGENALTIIRNFERNYSDEDISKNLELKISDVRATLNKLHNEGLVNYLREKDNETGWYSYSWSLNVDRVEKWAKGNMNEINADYENGQQYYFCGSCGSSSIVNFESAYDLNFKCERCEKALDHMDDKKFQDIYEKRKD